MDSESSESPAPNSTIRISVKDGDVEGASDPEKSGVVSMRVENRNNQYDEIDDGFKKKKQVFHGWTLIWLAYQSTGVIYGDIGTSPLYVYSSTFTSEPSREDLLGVLSIIIWSLILIVSVKYVCIVLFADDEGEGGTFALYSLLARYSNIMPRDPRSAITTKLDRYLTNDLDKPNRGVRRFVERSKVMHIFLQAIAVLGVSLVMADGVLTPAQSVLGAIQGIKVVDENITSDTIVGASCGILAALFLLQPLGVSKLGSAFAPIVVIWLLFNLSFAIYNLATHDASVLKAFSPYFAGDYFVRHGEEGWRSLGGILLCFTGVEAMFADLGAFSAKAIRISWLSFAFPCLLLAYIGQAAYIMDDPSAYDNPFFNTVPPGTFWPSLIISILAAIVASQAMITSSFQLLSQIMNLSFFPHIRMVYTSKKFHNQVYIPIANWLLLAGTLIVTIAYSNTTKLGEAYGVCVVLVTFITTTMVTLVAVIVWRLHILLVLAVGLPLLTLDGLYLSSALTKVPDGAWFTILLALFLTSMFTLWRFGKEHQWKSEDLDKVRVSQLSDKNYQTETAKRRNRDSSDDDLTTVKGLGIFFDKYGLSSYVPTVYAHFLRKFEARPEVSIFLHLRALHIPYIPDEDRFTVSDIPGIANCYRLTARHGYNERIVTHELNSIVYNQVRSFLIRDMRSCSETARRNSQSADADIPPAVAIAVDTSIPIETATSDDDATAAKAIAKLDHAYTTQTVYLVGKEQLRVIDPTSGMAWTDAALWKEMAKVKNVAKRIILKMFIWIRENSRAKVVNLNIPIERLVEVGFVKDI